MSVHHTRDLHQIFNTHRVVVDDRPDLWDEFGRRERAIAALRHRAGAPSGLSRFASQAKPLIAIAATVAVIYVLLVGALVLS